MPKLGMSKTQEYEQLQQSITNLKSAVDALTLEMAASRRAVASADLSALALRLDELEEEDKRAARPGRALRLAALCVGLLLLAGALTYVGVEGFANPLAVSSGFDEVSLALRVPAPTADQLGLLEAPYISTYVDSLFDPDNGFARYDIGVPVEYGGMQFALVLQGTARIQHPETFPFISASDQLSTITSLRSRLVPCAALSFDFDPASMQCQLITGRFPKNPQVDVPVASINKCTVTGAPDLSEGTQKLVVAEITGTPQLLTASDWAYQHYSLPGMEGESPQYADKTGGSNPYINKGWHGMPVLW